MEKKEVLLFILKQMQIKQEKIDLTNYEIPT